MKTSKRYNYDAGYRPNQAEEIVDKLNFIPRWLIDCGPGDGGEYLVFKKFWPTINMIGLEPSHAAYKLIHHKFNGILLNKAVWSSNGHLSIYNSDTLLHGHVKPLADKDSESCECVTLDEISKLYGDKDEQYGRLENCFVWADIEGSELEMLKGAVTLLKNRQIRGLNLEVHNDREKEIDDFLKDYKFRKALSYAHNTYHHDNLYLSIRQLG